MRAFIVGDWHVKPDEGLLTRDGTQKRLQPKVMDVLACLARDPGSLVTRDELLRQVWGEKAVSDEPLTRCIGELRSAFEDSAGDPQYIETLPKRGYRLVAEVAPEPGSPTDAAGAAPGTPAGRRPLAWGVTALLAALIAFIAWQFWPQQGRSPDAATDPSLAVLPFDNLSGSDEQDFLADGITATLTQVLSRNPRLRVVARTSAFVFKDRSADAREIGERLGVSTLLEGSLQRDGDTLRITAQLIDSASAVSLWSAAFDRPADQLFALQDEIATEVAAALSVTLLDADTPAASRYGAEDFDAYLAYVHALDDMRLRTTASMAAAIEQFRTAVSIDPSFALAWVGLAEALVINQWYADVPLAESLEQADEAIGRALAIDPELGEAWSVVGLMEFKRANYHASEQAFHKAVSLDPNNARAWFLYGTLLNDTGRPAQAIEKHRVSAQLDPLAPVVQTAIGVALEKLGRFVEAREQYSKVVRIDPGYPAAHDRLGILAWTVFGDAAEALAAHREALRLDPDNTWSRSLVVDMALGVNDPEMAEAWVAAAMRSGSSKLYPNLSRAYLMVFRGDPPEARVHLAERWLGDAFTYADIDVMLRIHRDAAIELGQPERSMELYRATLPELFAGDVEISTALFGPAIDLAYLLKLDGDDDRAHRLLGKAWDTVSNLPRGGCCGHGIADVEILAISGRHEEAIARLGQAFDSGFRLAWWWQSWRNPNLSPLNDRREYQELIQRFFERADRERSRLPPGRLPP